MAGAGGRRASSCWTGLLGQTKEPRESQRPQPSSWPTTSSTAPVLWAVPVPGVSLGLLPAFHGRAWPCPAPGSGHSELKSFTKFQHQVGRKERKERGLGPRVSLAQPDRSQRVNKSSSADKMPQIPGLASNGECVWQMSTIKKYILMAHDAAATVGRSRTKQVLSSHYCVLLPGTRATPPGLFHKLWP